MSNPRRTPAAAHYIGCSESFLNKDRAKGGAGRVAYRRIGRIVVYDEPDLDSFKAANRVEPKVQSHQQRDSEQHLTPD